MGRLLFSYGGCLLLGLGDFSLESFFYLVDFLQFLFSWLKDILLLIPIVLCLVFKAASLILHALNLVPNSTKLIPSFLNNHPYLIHIASPNSISFILDILYIGNSNPVSLSRLGLFFIDKIDNQLFIFVSNLRDIWFKLLFLLEKKFL